MPAPPVTIYVTSLTSQPKVRKHIDLLHRALKGLEIPYESFDLAIDEDAKRRWQRAKPTDRVVGLPGYLVGGEWIGTMDDFEDAVETQTLETFLMQEVEHADASQTIGEAELDRLMREMTDEDLDQLVGDLSVEDVSITMAAGAEAPKPAGTGILASIEHGLESAAGAVKHAVGDVAGAVGVSAGEAGQASNPAPKAETEEKRESLGAKIAAAAGAFADEANEQSVAEAVAEEKDDGPKPGEKTLDEIIDETMAKEKEEYVEKEEEKAEVEKKIAIKEANDGEQELIRKDE